MKRGWPPYGFALVGLGLILLFNAVASPGFLALEIRDGQVFGSLIDILNRAAPVVLVSLGMTLVIAAGGVDLSVGSSMAIASAAAGVLLAPPPGAPFDPVSSAPLVVLAALAAAGLCGALNGILVGWVGMQPIVATLALMVAGRGVAQLITQGQIIVIDSPEFEALGTGSAAGLPTPVVLAGVCLAALILAVRRTAWGLFTEAVGSNPRAAQLAGLPVRGIKMAAYTVCGLAAGLAGSIACADIQAADANNTGLYLELDAILAVSIGGGLLTGGRFSLAGAAVGAVLMQALTTTLLSRGVPPPIALSAKAGLIIAVVLFQSLAFRQAIARRRAASA